MRDIKLREIENHANYMFQYVSNALEMLGLEVKDKHVKITQFHKIGGLESQESFKEHFKTNDKRFVYFGELFCFDNVMVEYLGDRAWHRSGVPFTALFNSLEYVNKTINYTFLGYRIEFPKGSDMGLLDSITLLSE